MSNLLVAGIKCDERIRISQVNESRANTLNSRIEFLEAEITSLVGTCNHLVKMVKNAEAFISKRKEQNLATLNRSIHEVSAIVPNSEVSDIFVSVDGKKAKLAKRSGGTLAGREGSAAVSTASVLLRFAAIRSKPNTLQISLFDEAFFALSDISTDNIREYLKLFGRDMLIIGIEQRKMLFEGIATTEVIFTKINGKTKIEVVQREAG